MLRCLLPRRLLDSGMTTSPLGKYGPLVAACASLGILVVYAIAAIFQSRLTIDHDTMGQLQELAFLAAGIIFGTATTANGWKAPVETLSTHAENNTSIATEAMKKAEAANARLDALSAPPAAKINKKG
jgi:hypothetical protein